MESIKRFFSAPVFGDDEEKTRRAQLLHVILTAQAGVLLLVISGTLIAIFSTGANRWPEIMVMTIASLVIILWRWLMWRGQVSLASGGMLIFFMGSVTLILANGGTIRSTGVIYFPLTIVMATLLINRKVGLVAFAITSLIGILLIEGEIRGFLTAPENTISFSSHAIVVSGLGLATVLLYLATRGLEDALERARRNEREVRELASNLEVRVAERTRDLTLSAEIARAVAEKRNLDELLPNAVEHIRESFNLYYTQIYLTDSAGRTLVLRAGSGTVGEQLLNRGHRLSIDYASINGSAASSKKSIVVEDTGKSETFLPNPLLPDTRSELAVPLISGERVLGVLNMQSAYPRTFTQENLPAYEILAGQLAAALENAYQFTEIEQARSSVAAQSLFLTREGWNSYLDAVRQPEYLGVSFQNGSVSPLSVPVTQTPGKSLSVPISIAGVEIGNIQLEKEDARWTPQEEEVASRLAALAGQHMENLRLLAEAEAYRREAERAARRLAREGWDSYQQLAEEPYKGFVYTNNRVKPLPQNGDDEVEYGTNFPLTVHGETIGTLELLMSKGAPSFDSEAEALVKTITETLSSHLENLRLAQATEMALTQTETLYNLTTQLTKAETLEEVLQAIATTRPGGNASLLTIETDSNGMPDLLISTASWPQDSSQGALGAQYPIHNFPISKLWMNKPGEALLFGNIETDPRMDPQTRAINQHFGFHAAAYLPLKVGNLWIGLISVSWERPQVFTEADTQLFDAITAQAAVVVNNRLLFTQTVKRAERESLINTINQRIQGATSVEGALETAAREIGHLLKARRAVVELGVAANGER